MKKGLSLAILLLLLLNPLAKKTHGESIRHNLKNPLNIERVIRTEKPALKNPSLQPIRTTDYYGSGDLNLDKKVNQADYEILKKLKPNDKADINGDGLTTKSDLVILENYLDGSIDHLPAWWNKLNRKEKETWTNKVSRIDQTDKKDYIEENYTYVCFHFATQFFTNTHGYNKKIPSKLTGEHNGRFNIPMYCVYISDNKNYAHEINAILIGNDIHNLNDWMFIEPRDDSKVNMQNWRYWLDKHIYIEEPYKFTNTDEYEAHIIADFFLAAREPNSLENSIILSQNYPNPATNSTKIEYFIKDFEENISLKVYNILGQKVKTLIDNKYSQGNHWIDFNTNNLPNGTYFYKLTTSRGTQMKKMMIIKEKKK